MIYTVHDTEQLLLFREIHHLIAKYSNELSPIVFGGAPLSTQIQV